MPIAIWILLLLLQGTSSTRPTEDTPFLRVDGESVSLDEFGRWLLEVEGEHMAGDFARKCWAIDREAERLNLSVEDAEVEAELDPHLRVRIEGAYSGSRDDCLAELARTGRTESGLLRQRFVETRPELQTRAIASLDRVVPEVVIRRAWELRYGRNGRRYDLRMMRFKVVVPSRPELTREEWKAGREAAMEATKRKAEAARARVAAGEAFGLIAARESDDPDTRDHRGVPSGGFRDAGWPGSFLDALETLAPGELSPPLLARGGWWIVELRSLEITPLEAVRGAIEADLVARGPEPFEIGLVLDRVAEGLQVRVLPALFEPPQTQEWPSALEPVLRINGEDVSRGEYARWLLDAIGETLVDTFVEERLLRERVAEAGFEVGEAEVTERTHEYLAALVAEGYRGNREAWVTYLQRGGRTEEAFVRRIARRMRLDLLTEKLFLRDRVLGPGEVEARFADAFGPEGLRREARMIMCAIRGFEPPPGLTREELQSRMGVASEEARLRAAALCERARLGGDFAALARQSSDDDRTREAGGALPDRFRADQWSEPIAEAVATLEPGQVTEPLLFGSAWFVFQLVSERRVTFEEVRDELEQEMRVARPFGTDLAGYRNELGKKARVERDPSGRR
jgi:parvulin-like peptidyl-prolyl isomerase